MFSCSPDLHTVKLFCLLFNFCILLSNFCWSLTEIQTDCHWWRWSYVDSHICNESSDDAGCWNQTHSSVTSPKQIIVSQIEMQLCFCIKGPFPVIKPSEFHLPGTGFCFCGANSQKIYPSVLRQDAFVGADAWRLKFNISLLVLPLCTRM